MSGRRGRADESQAGIALLLVVWLLALFTVIAGEFMASGRVKAAAEHNKRDDLRGLALALAGYRAAQAALDEKIVGLSLDEEGGLLLGYSGLEAGEAAAATDVPLGDGTYSYRISDEDGLVNINNGAADGARKSSPRVRHGTRSGARHGDRQHPRLARREPRSSAQRRRGGLLPRARPPVFLQGRALRRRRGTAPRARGDAAAVHGRRRGRPEKTGAARSRFAPAPRNRPTPGPRRRPSWMPGPWTGPAAATQPSATSRHFAIVATGKPAGGAPSRSLRAVVLREDRG